MIGRSTVINQFLPCFFFKTPDVWWCFGASRVGSHGPNFVRWFTYDLRCDIPQLANSEKLPEGEPVISHDISVKSYLYIQWYLYFLMLKFHVWWFHTACVAPFFDAQKAAQKCPNLCGLMGGLCDLRWWKHRGFHWDFTKTWENQRRSSN